MENEKPKKKKPSMSSTIRRLREEVRDLNDANWRAWRSREKLEKRIKELEALLPLKYYRIEYKGKNKEGTAITAGTTIVEGYATRLVVEELKGRLYHPESFELVNITVLGN